MALPFIKAAVVLENDTKTVGGIPNVPVTVAVQVTGVNPASIEDVVKGLVEDYFDTVQVGDAVRRLPVIVAVGGISGVISVDVLLNGAAVDVVVSEVQVGRLSGNVVVS